MHAKYPKILPWLAKKAGVSLKRAEALWKEALRYSTANSRQIESPKYWELAVNRLIVLLEVESRKLSAMPFGFGPLVRLPARLWLHGLTAQQALLDIATSSVRSTCWWGHRVC